MMMLPSRVFLMLLAISTALTIFTASMVSSSMGFSVVSFLPACCKRNPDSHSNATMEDPNDISMIDYNDVDFLSYELEHQIIQLLGDEKDSVHRMQDMYPGQGGLRGSYDKYMQKTPYLRYKYCKEKDNLDLQLFLPFNIEQEVNS